MKELFVFILAVAVTAVLVAGADALSQVRQTKLKESTNAQPKPVVPAL